MAGDLHPSSTHPPLPPTTEDNRYRHLRLLRSRRVGPVTYHKLLSEFGTASAALEALPEIAAEAGVTKYAICPEGVIDAELRAGRKAGAKLVFHGDLEYPDALIQLDPAPPALWCLGDVTLLARPMIAVAGARNASALGVRTSAAIARDLGTAGFVVVSGLARGIDTAAHKAALPTGTIAVMAGGVDVIYPPENERLAQDIAKSGLRLSEQPPGMAPQARHFAARNRIIAGLGQACVIIEAALRSGSMITAQDASEIGRDILCVPGHPFDARSAGCNALIRDGATLVRHAQDVVEAVSTLAPQRPAPREILQRGAPVTTPLSQQAANIVPPEAAAMPHDLHAEILSRLGSVPMPLDALLDTLPVPPDNLAPILTEMELAGQIKRHAGGQLTRCA